MLDHVSKSTTASEHVKIESENQASNYIDIDESIRVATEGSQQNTSKLGELFNE